MKKRVVVGMSGGVDSSVAAYLLKKEGYDVVGLFMRNWKESDDSGCCTAEQDFNDVRTVSQKLDIPYYTVDFSEQYMDKVFKLFVDEYKKGRTPNPDVLCNKEIKFDAFSHFAKELEADYLATGHYCDIEHTDTHHNLLRSMDENKDQTYFLNQVKEEQIKNVLFPLGHIVKTEVREIARSIGLSTAEKKDSTGVCFIGERNFRDFLKNYIPMKEGDIIDDKGNIVGRHSGVFYYTVGQRRGLGIGGMGDCSRWFVTGKDIQKNILYVTQGDKDVLYSNGLITAGFNFISIKPENNIFDCMVRIRHRQPLVKAKATIIDSGLKIEFEEKIRGVAEGQFAVIYGTEKDKNERLCYGGGEIDSKF